MNSIKIEQESIHCYRVMNNTSEVLNCNLKERGGKYIVMKVEGGPAIGIGGNLKCFGIDETVTEIVVRDKQVYLKTTNNNIMEKVNQLLELLGDPEIVSKARPVIVQELKEANAKVKVLEARLSLLDRLEGNPKSVEKTTMVRSIKRVAPETKYNGLLENVVRVITQADKPVSATEIGDVLKATYNLKRKPELKKLNASISATLAQNVNGKRKPPILERIKEGNVFLYTQKTIQP